MRLRQKLALAFIFCLVIITMTISIIRFAVVIGLYHQPEQSWLYFWNGIENTIGKSSSQPGQSANMLPSSLFFFFVF